MSQVIKSSSSADQEEGVTRKSSYHSTRCRHYASRIKGSPIPKLNTQLIELRSFGSACCMVFFFSSHAKRPTEREGICCVFITISTDSLAPFCRRPGTTASELCNYFRRHHHRHHHHRRQHPHRQCVGWGMNILDGMPSPQRSNSCLPIPLTVCECEFYLNGFCCRCCSCSQ